MTSSRISCGAWCDSHDESRLSVTKHVGRPLPRVQIDMNATAPEGFDQGRLKRDPASDRLTDKLAYLSLYPLLPSRPETLGRRVR
jgi:hypothetical protein